MATIVDSLFIELGLDPTKFQKGQKEAAASFAKTRDEARKTGKDITDLATKAAEGLDNVARKALSLFAAFAGARSIKDFAESIVASDTAVGRLARNLGVSSSTLSTWGLAAASAGGSADAAAASFQNLTDGVYRLQTEGGTALTTWLGKLQQASHVRIHLDKGADQMLLDLSAAMASPMGRNNPGLMHFMMRQAGIDQGLFPLIDQGPDAVRRQQEIAKRYAPTPEQIAASQKLNQAWVALQNSATALGRSILTALSPALIGLLEWARTFLDEHPNIVTALAAISAAVVSLFALWAGSSVLKTIAGIVRLRKAFAALAVETVGIDALKASTVALGVEGLAALGPLAATLAGIAGVLGLAVALNPSPLNEGEDEIARQRRYGQGGGGGTGAGRGLSGNAAPQRGGHGNSGGWWTTDRQKHAFDVLTQNGVSERGAIALISRWKNVESSGRGPDALNPRSGAYGIEQGLGSRKPRTNDFDEQLKAAARETRNREGMGSGRIFDNAKDDREAARGASVHERAEGWNGYTDSFQNATLAGMAAVRRAVTGGGASWAPNNPLPPHIHAGLIGLRAAAAAARSGAVSNDNRSMDTHSTHIGKIEVHTPATDGPGVAADIKKSLRAQSFAARVNSGPK